MRQVTALVPAQEVQSFSLGCKGTRAAVFLSDKVAEIFALRSRLHHVDRARVTGG
jgi:hypothetical protein